MNWNKFYIEYITSNDSNAFKCIDSKTTGMYTKIYRMRKRYTLNTANGTCLSIEFSQMVTFRSKIIGNEINFENIVSFICKCLHNNPLSLVVWFVITDTTSWLFGTFYTILSSEFSGYEWTTSLLEKNACFCLRTMEIIRHVLVIFVFQSLIICLCEGFYGSWFSLQILQPNFRIKVYF